MKKISIYGLGSGLVAATAAHAATQVAHHQDPVASIILGATLLFFFAVLGRGLAKRFNQPGVLGELLMGVLLGNIGYYFQFQIAVILREGPAIINIIEAMLQGLSLSDAVNAILPNPKDAVAVLNALKSHEGFDYFKIAYVVDIFSRYGIIFLLFMVGLESSVDELKKSGGEALRVAVIGVIAPIALGLLVAYYLLPTASFNASLFISATLCATSIGISARVLTDLNKLKTKEAQTILGAAMIDDVLGLIILAIVSGIVMSGHVSLMLMGKIVILSLMFFTMALLMGPIVLRYAVKFFKFLDLWEAKLFISFIFVMLLAWFASVVELATIIGAFTAGVVLHDTYFEKGPWPKNDALNIKNLIAPLESILAPLFFMLIGIQVKLETFLHLNVIGEALALLAAAILGKLVSGLGASRRSNRLIVGVGMLPRGEVGLVFASIGRGLGVINDELFSAIILMVIFTTFIAPPVLKGLYSKQS